VNAPELESSVAIATVAREAVVIFYYARSVDLTMLATLCGGKTLHMSNMGEETLTSHAKGSRHQSAELAELRLAGLRLAEQRLAELRLAEL